MAETKYKGRELIRSADGATKDIMMVLLDANKDYSTSEVKKLVDQFLKKEVKE